MAISSMKEEDCDRARYDNAMSPDLQQIEFLDKESLLQTQGARLSPSSKLLVNRLDHFGFDFRSYRELFEREVLETMLRLGEFSSLELLPVDIGSHLKTQPAAQILGVNLHSERRRETLADLYCKYDNAQSKPDFFRRGDYLDTRYFKEESLTPPRPRIGRLTLPNLGQKSHLLRVAKSRIRMLLNFRAAGGITGDSLSTRPTNKLNCFDLPWAINYMGTIKLRDGAHRRSTLEYLGHKAIPTIVVDTKGLGVSDFKWLLRPELECIARHFGEFESILRYLAFDGNGRGSGHSPG